MSQQTTPKAMPDVADQAKITDGLTLDWVGMAEIAIPVLVKDQDRAVRSAAAKVQAYVSLDDAQAKGIHMSRLYLALDLLAEQAVGPNELEQLLTEFLTTHQGLSDNAFVEFRFDCLLRRESLLSGNSGVKSYPVRLRASQHKGAVSLELGLAIDYSSTCPCSAALSRQLMQEAFERQFAGQALVDADKISQWLRSEAGLAATPHSQRSTAQLWLRLAPDLAEFPITELVDQVEAALRTPVQTAVKRADEQEFARLNAQNLMFCEDAARKVSKALIVSPSVKDFWLRVNHYESLHAHDAVAINTKGVVGGYQPEPNLY